MKPDPLGEVLAGLAQAEHLARLHHQHWAADACADAVRIISNLQEEACLHLKEKN